METKIIPGETEANFMIRCIEQKKQMDGLGERDAAPICYYYWQSQNGIEIRDETDPEAARNKYSAYLRGYNYKKP
jgi:hypothetical protein